MNQTPDRTPNRTPASGTPRPVNIHATTVAIQGFAVMLLGPAGAGKSDLGLRLIDRGARLVADDRTVLARRDEGLWAEPPPALAGLIEVRGLGIVRLPEWVGARLTLVVDLAAAPDHVPERLPEPLLWTGLGVSVPLIHLCPWAASAVVKVEWAARLASDAVRDGVIADRAIGPETGPDRLYIIAGALRDEDEVRPRQRERVR